MRYDSVKKRIILEKQENDIVDTAIVELGGPFHSSFAKHLQKYHFQDYELIKKELNLSSSLLLKDLHLVIDILQIFLVEPLESDWGTTYDSISQNEVKDLLATLITIYSNRVKKY